MFPNDLLLFCFKNFLFAEFLFVDSLPPFPIRLIRCGPLPFSGEGSNPPREPRSRISEWFAPPRGLLFNNLEIVYWNDFSSGPAFSTIWKWFEAVQFLKLPKVKVSNKVPALVIKWCCGQFNLNSGITLSSRFSGRSIEFWSVRHKIKGYCRFSSNLLNISFPCFPICKS